jgi:predicted nucleic acid binding AN1-type Zn finger protein
MGSCFILHAQLFDRIKLIAFDLICKVNKNGRVTLWWSAHIFSKCALFYLHTTSAVVFIYCESKIMPTLPPEEERFGRTTEELVWKWICHMTFHLTGWRWWQICWCNRKSNLTAQNQNVSLYMPLNIVDIENGSVKRESKSESSPPFLIEHLTMRT